MPGRSILACLWLAATVFAAQPEDVQLARIIRAMADNLARVPNYTCTQTVDRWRSGDPCPKCEYQDRLRLEVAIVGKQERFAWPDAGGFEDRDLLEMVGGGAVLSGDFAGFARGVFLNAHAVYSPAGETKLGNRPALRYGFKIPVAYSGFRVRTGKAEAIVGYEGSFWVDARTLDVLRLDFHSSGISTPVSILQVNAAIEYGRVRIGNSDFLLPRTTKTTILSRDGGQSRNFTSYGACHQYAGQSTIRFGESDEAPGSEARAPVLAANRSVPPGLSLDTVLASSIRLAECAIGDAVTMVVARPARSGDFRVPKGALLRGRIVQMVAHLQPQPGAMLGVRVSTLESGGQRLELRAKLQSLAGISGGVRLQRMDIEGSGADAAVVLGRAQSAIPKGSHFYWTTTAKEQP